MHHIRNFVGRDAQSYPGLQLVWSSASSGANLVGFAKKKLEIKKFLEFSRIPSPLVTSSAFTSAFHVKTPLMRSQSSATSLRNPLSSHGNSKTFCRRFTPIWRRKHLTELFMKIFIELLSGNSVEFQPENSVFSRNDSLSLSIYASKNQIGTYKTIEMEAFAAKHFVAANGALVGINVDQQILTSYAEESGAITDGRHIPNHGSPFRGGDFRRFARGNTVHVIIAGEGAGITDAKARAVQAVFLAHLGRESPLKFASLPGTQSVLAKLGVPGAGFQAVHDGSGLVGAYLILEAKIADRVLRGFVDQLRSIKVEDVEGELTENSKGSKQF